MIHLKLATSLVGRKANYQSIVATMDNRNGEDASETETFLSPRNNRGKSETIDDSCKIPLKQQLSEKKLLPPEDGITYYDPFKARNQPNATTDFETLTHLLKACLGTGILAMPYAFKNAGVVFGVVATALVAIICTHCAYILVKCAHKLYYKTRVSSLTYPDVGEVAFANGPDWGKKFAKPARLCVIIGIFLTYFGTCSAYTVIIAENIEQVVQHHFSLNLSIRWYIAGLLIPLILISYIPNLKSLAVFSLIANILMGATIIIALYYISEDIKNPLLLPKMADWSSIPEFFSVTIFAMECIGVIMPLENNMLTPQNFLGSLGVLNRGMAMVSLIYLFLGLFGFLRYGDGIKATISLNLDINQIAPQCAKIFTAVAIFFTYALQFFVCLEICWNGIKDYYSKQQLFYNYVLRTFLVILSVLVALLVPQIAPFLGLVGAFCFSSLGLLFPVLIEVVVYWDEGFGRLNWRIWKNIVIFVFGLLALIFGSHSSIKDIVNIYMEKDTSLPLPVLNATYLSQ